MRHIYFTVSILLAASIAATAQSHKSKVLFVGNSYVLVNDLPTVLYNAALSAGDTITYTNSSISGSTLQQHVGTPATVNNIALGGWDFVILQEQSQKPSFPISQVEVEVFPYAKTLDSLVHQYNICGKSLFYMTWGRKNGDTLNCPTWPPVCTYQGMDSLLYERYMTMADTNHGVVSPVGPVWRYIRTHFPSINLYMADESHPSAAGTYAAACSFYTAIFKRNPQLVTNNYTLSATDAANIRLAAKAVVFDSMSKWHIGQYDLMPQASYSVGTGNNVTFTNTSTHATSYLWSFGDGQTDTASNPTHHYTASGSYHAYLVAIGCKRDTLYFTVNVNVTGVAEHHSATNFTLAPNPAHNLLNISSPLFTTDSYQILITNSLGQTVYTSQTSAATQQSIDLTALATGMYIISVTDKGEVVYRDKFLKQ